MLRSLRGRLRLLLDRGRLRVLEAPPSDEGKAQEVLAPHDAADAAAAVVEEDDADRDADGDGGNDDDAGSHIRNRVKLNDDNRPDHNVNVMQQSDKR